MGVVLFIKVAIALVAGVAWAYGKLNAGSSGPVPAPLAATPPPAARRGRRPRPSAPKLSVEPPPAVPVAPVPAHLDETTLVVARPARAQSRLQFRGRAALRQAIVAREVLGPPLSLRTPRF
jgi:hypothetical protein